jgi:hypothetical protein
LNGGLLIHAEEGRVLRRVEIKAKDVGRFGFKSRIVLGDVTLQAM